ncbi:MAG: hypothetical protein ACK559_21160, partial [bacterium]
PREHLLLVRLRALPLAFGGCGASERCARDFTAPSRGGSGRAGQRGLDGAGGQREEVDRGDGGESAAA